MDNFDRTLSVFADGEPVTSSARTKLLGHEGLGLYPSLFMLNLLNLAEEDYLLLSRAREVEVKHGEVVLVSGLVSDVFRNTKKNGTETHVAVSPGLALWEAVVSVDVESGVSVSETVRQLLEASGTGVQLLSFPGEDPVSTRGQVSPKEGLPVSMILTEEDLQEAPAFNGGGDMILRTGPAGWTLGKYAEVRYGGMSSRGLISERLLNLDTGDGPWRVELIVELVGQS